LRKLKRASTNSLKGSVPSVREMEGENRHSPVSTRGKIVKESPGKHAGVQSTRVRFGRIPLGLRISPAQRSAGLNNAVTEGVKGTKIPR